MARHLDDRARDDISAAVRRFVDAGETFTAAHVTMSLRADGAWAGTYSHLDGVAPEVRRIFGRGDMDGYRQTLLSSMGGSDGVFAYHPAGQDPSTVDLRIGGQGWLPRVSISDFRDGADGGTGTSITPIPRPAISTSGIPLARDLYNGGRTAQSGDHCCVLYNNDGYAQIPRAMTRLLGWDSGVGVKLEGVTLGGSVTVRLATDGEDPDIRLQATSGAFRVRDRSLMPYGVGDGDYVGVTVDTVAGTLTLR